MLFNIYVKPLSKVVRRFGLRCLQYADDTQVYLCIPLEPKGVEIVDQCLEGIMGFKRVNKLNFNLYKTEVGGV